MDPPESDPLKATCRCEKCTRFSPGGKVVSRRTWYRHNPGGKKAKYGALTAEETKAFDRIAAFQHVHRPGRNARKLGRHLETEEIGVTSHPSKRAAGSGSSIHFHMNVTPERETSREISPSAPTPEPERENPQSPPPISSRPIKNTDQVPPPLSPPTRVF
ncbi:hypothetical protein BJ322DRAFT_1074659 [Thelephora terrestris]|uniref:Uncharacterized protein n=1 Tax=Thelephora terrestris TaxID=56493 RepID=A0A9P6H916_9AGAM|nr:hypothetical protein BJ322DRAFT_1074659 [Thelephora terrestris]